jgi:hypothetical protein
LPVGHIHAYLVHPRKGSKGPRRIGGTNVPLQGRLFNLLNDVYVKSDHECDTDISFNQSADGRRHNECRSLITAYLSGPTIARGRRIAERFESVTTHRSGLGLLFLIPGDEGSDHKIVISRFPADSAILAEESRATLTVAFLERVFMKSATAYKAAAYQHASLRDGFWRGKAVDKQINSEAAQLSNYWIFEFLDSDFITTAAAGTKRFAVALRDAARKSDTLAVKSEIAAAVTLSGSLAGRRLSARGFANRLGLSQEATSAVLNQLRSPELADENFQFDLNEFRAQVPYRSVELDSGGVLTAQSFEFDQVFQREIVDPETQEVRYSTQGRVVQEKLTRTT